MMKTTFLTGVIFAVIAANAQTCDKYLQTDVIDPFTGEKLVYTEPAVFSQPTVTDSRAASFRVLDGNRFYFHLSSGRSSDLVYGSDVVLTFADEEKMTLQIEQLNREKVGTEYVTEANCRVYKREDVERFYTQKVVGIKIISSKLEFEIAKSDQTRILAGALCLIENVGIDNINFNSERNTALVPDASGGAFVTGSGSSVIISGSVKCEFVKDTMDAGTQIKLSKSKDICSSPYKLSYQLEKNGDKLFLHLTYSHDLGNLNSESYVIFRFENGKSLKFNHKGDPVKQEKPTFVIDLTLFKTEFMENDLSAIRLSYSEYFVDLAASNATSISGLLRYCF